MKEFGKQDVENKETRGGGRSQRGPLKCVLEWRIEAGRAYINPPETSLSQNPYFMA